MIIKNQELGLDERIEYFSILEGSLANTKGRKRSYQSDITNSHDKCERNLRYKSSDKTDIEESDREWSKEMELNKKIYKRMLAVYINEETEFRYIIKTGMI